MENLYLAVISEVRGDKVRVAHNGLTTDFLPLIAMSNSFMRVWIAPKIGEQVLVLAPFGELNSGFVLRGIYQERFPSPSLDDDTAHIEFSDGTKLIYKLGELNIEVKGKVNLKANSVVVDSPSIDLGIGGKGVVTSECICAFTGSPHPQGSSNTRSKI